MKRNWGAACGLNCETCEIRLAPHDADAAEGVMKWFRSMAWLKEDEGMDEVIERRMYCTGCHGSRETHWSADCWILICCVDDHNLNNCSECETFPCDRLLEWSGENKSYEAAFAGLNALNETRSSS